MIKILETINDTMKIEEINTIKEKCWIHLTSPDDSEVSKVSSATGISEDMIKAALDEEETARFEKEDDAIFVVIDIPVIEEDDNSRYIYTTIPLGIIYNQNYIVTVTLRDSALIYDFQNGRVKNFSTSNQNKMLLQILYLNSTKFLQHLRQIDRTSLRVQAKLNKNLKNKNLMQLFDLEKSLVYFSTSLRSNNAVLQRLAKFYQLLNVETDVDLLDDVQIENNQAIEMCNIYRDILSSSMAAYSSVISNNVNLVMKVLTLITIIISIPTLIFSFYGMNIKLPLEDSKFAYLIIIGITVAITAVIAIVLFKNTNHMNKRK